MTHAKKSAQDSRSRRADDAERSNAPGCAATWTDNRPAAIAQRRWIDAIPQSPRVVAQEVMSARIGGSLVASRVHRTMPMVKAPGPAGAVVIQGKGEYGKLHLLGWRFSGGTMATRDIRAHWHASVFRVTSSGANSDTGLFFDGFHLTNSAFDAGMQPHVFFSQAGAHEEARTRSHPQSSKFAEREGDDALDDQINDAIPLAPTAVKALGADLSADEEKQLEASDAVHRQERAKAEQQGAEEATAAFAAAQAQAEQSASEDEHIKLLLVDSNFGAGSLPLFRRHLAGEADLPMPSLKPLADWYGARRSEGWVVALPAVKRASANPPSIEKREGATERLQSKPAGKGKKNFTVTYSYKGYGTYRKDPLAERPPKL